MFEPSAPDSSLSSCLDRCLPELICAPRWLVGYSGGVDSSVLLSLLADWCAGHPDAPPLSAIHVNHQLQDEAVAWAAHCQTVCASLEIPLVTAAAQVRSTDEAGARDARYQVFEEQLEAGDVLFLAHHLDDQVETFFLRLMRGAGLEGLRAIPASRALGSGTLMRPLLGVSRAEIAHYAETKSLSVVEDPSNADTQFDRNYLRADVLPQLAGRWPGYRQTVTRAIGHISAAAATLAEQEGAVAAISTVTGDRGLPLQALQSDTAGRVLRRWIVARGFRAPDQAALDEFLRQLASAAPDSAPLLQSSAYDLRRFGAGVYLLPRGATDAPTAALTITPGERRVITGVGVVTLRAANDGALLLGTGESLQLRWRTGGENCRPIGGGGVARGRSSARGSSTTSLKKILHEAEIPPWWRNRVPLLYRGEVLLAVGDLTCCEPGDSGASLEAGLTQFELVWEPQTAP